MKTTMKPLIFGLLAIVLTSCGGKTDSQKEDAIVQNTKQVSTAAEGTAMADGMRVIRKGDLQLKKIIQQQIPNHGLISGRVVPKNTTQLFAEVQGRLLQGAKAFKSGNTLQKGQVLLRIDSREFELNLEAQKSAFLNILTGMMPDLKADYPTNYQAWLTYVSQYQSGKSLPPLPPTTSAAEKYFVTANQVYNTYFAIKAQEERLSKYTIYAPYSGTLSETMVDQGSLVSPGQPLGTFMSNSDYELEAGVPVSMMEHLHLGQQIVLVNPQSKSTYSAVVKRINDLIDPNTQNVPVYLKLKGAGLKSGMYLEGSVLLETFSDAVTVPKDIVTRDKNVYLLKNDVMTKTPITVLASSRDSVIIKGLKNNDLLVLNTFADPVSGLKILN